jgi:hypothetical protein
LLKRAQRAGEARSLGLFLDLTTQLTGERLFEVQARKLRHGRAPRDSFFFVDAAKPVASGKVAKLDTSSLAKRWHYLMNMPMDSFQSLFDRQADRLPRVTSNRR